MFYSTGADWLTLTNIWGDNSDRKTLMGTFLEMTNKRVKWGAGGYGGQRDPDCGVKYGSRLRKDGRAEEMLICPGANADLALEMIDDPLEYRATRLDLHLTVSFEEPNPGLVKELYEKLVEAKAKGGNITKRRKIALVQSETGATLYLGSRKTGRKFFRLYDKSHDLGAESGKVWRQEIQYGRDLAQDALTRYLDVDRDQAATISLVCAEFSDALGYSLFGFTGKEAKLVTTIRKPLITLEAKLDWLRDCVRPTIALMLASNLEAEMLDALGLERAGVWKEIKDLGENPHKVCPF